MGDGHHVPAEHVDRLRMEALDKVIQLARAIESRCEHHQYGHRLHEARVPTIATGAPRWIHLLGAVVGSVSIHWLQPTA